MKGKIRLKKSADDKQYYAVKILRPADEEEAAAVREKRENLRKKRKSRRKHKQET